MSLREIRDDGSVYEVPSLPYQLDFDRIWKTFSQHERDAMVHEIGRRLDQPLTSPDPNWGSITNTSIEGGRENPRSGIRGDWRGTAFEPIFEHFGDDQLAGMFYGNVWKMVIIERPEHWIGIRSDPTFPQRGITLGGKTYFHDSKQTAD